MAEAPSRTVRGRSMGNMTAIPPDNMLLAVPKKGRLNEKVMKLLVDGVGMEYRRPDRVDVAHCTNMAVSFPTEIHVRSLFFSRWYPSDAVMGAGHTDISPGARHRGLRGGG